MRNHRLVFAVFLNSFVIAQAGLSNAEEFATLPPSPTATENLSPRHQDTSKLSALDLVQQGKSLERKGDFSGAFQAYLQAFTLDSSNPQAQAGLRRTNTILGNKAQKARDKERRAYVREALKLREKNKSKHEALMVRHKEGLQFLKKGKLLQASDVFNRLLEESPSFEPPVRGIAKVQKQLASRLKKSRFPSPQYYSASEGIYMFNQSDWNKASESLEKALNAGPLPDDLAVARVGEYAAAARVKAESQSWTVERKILMEKAKRDFDAGRLKDAQLLYQSIVEKNASDIEAKRQLEMVNKMIAGAREDVVKETQAKEISDRMANGTLLAIQNRHSEAMEEFLRVLELDPKNEEAKEQLSDVRKSMKKRGIFVPDVSTTEDDAEKLYKEGLQLYGNERYEDARKAFENALKINPDHNDAKLALERLRGKTRQ